MYGVHILDQVYGAAPQVVRRLRGTPLRPAARPLLRGHREHRQRPRSRRTAAVDCTPRSSATRTAAGAPASPTRARRKRRWFTRAVSLHQTLKDAEEPGRVRLAVDRATRRRGWRPAARRRRPASSGSRPAARHAPRPSNRAAARRSRARLGDEATGLERDCLKPLTPGKSRKTRRRPGEGRCVTTRRAARRYLRIRLKDFLRRPASGRRRRPCRATGSRRAPRRRRIPPVTFTVRASSCVSASVDDVRTFGSCGPCRR